MKHRIVNFESRSIRVVNDNGMEYICLMDVVNCLGLKWANENQRARDKFDVTNCVLPVLNSHKMSVTSVISFGNLESYLHSFKDRHGGFKPPQGFYHTLRRMIEELPGIIFDSQPDMTATSPNTVNGVDTVQKDEDEQFDEIQAIADEMKEEALKEMDLNEKQVDPETEFVVEQNFVNELDYEDNSENNVPVSEPHELEAASYTAFPLSDGFKGNIDNMIDSTDLFIDALSEFKKSLEELRKSQFVMLKNSK